MDVMKERWEAPRTVYEGFVVDQYVTACKDTGDWVVTDGHPVHPHTKFYLDYDRDGILDPEEKDKKKEVTTNNSWDGNPPSVGTQSYWGWMVDAPLVRYRLFRMQNDNQWLAYDEEYVINRNHS